MCESMETKKYKVLVTTWIGNSNSAGGCAVTTITIEFDDYPSAKAAEEKINKNYMTFGSLYGSQKALLLG